MPYRDIAKRRACQKRYYLKHKDLYREKNVRRKRMLLEFVNEIKNISCIDCKGLFPPYVMDFDHRGEEKKLSSIARMVRDGHSKQSLLHEMNKCDLVCANCHRIRTYKRLIAE